MDRRHLIKHAGAVLAATAVTPVAAQNLRNDGCHRTAAPATFVLVHGAWGGGFDLEQVTQILLAKGHRVYAPALTGVGERSHLLSPDISLQTHIDDVVNCIRFKDLSDVVLIGHSSGGMAVTGAADQISERIASLVYLDAFLPESGQAIVDMGISPQIVEDILAAHQRGETSFPFPQTMIEDFGIPESVRWRYTPQPISTYLDAIELTGGLERIPRKLFVKATRNVPGFASIFERVSADPAWRTATIDAGHDLVNEAPEATAEILETAI